MIHDPEPHEPTGPVADDRLRLIFTCCHPALAPEARVALTLRLLGGLTVAEIAAAFLVPETTMAQRITRAKRKIAGAGIPYRVPELSDLPARLAGVLAVLYLVFNEGYLAELRRRTGTPRAQRRGDPADPRAAVAAAGQPEVTGLLALMLLSDARRDSRFAGGDLVPLRRPGPRRLGPGADRRGPRPGARVPRPRARHRRAARPLPAAGRDQRGPHRRARGRRHRLGADRGALRPAGADRRLADRAAQPGGGDRRARRARGRAGRGRPARPLGLDRYHAWHATRADLLRRLGRPAESRAAYDAAIEAAGNEAERAWLARRRDTLVGDADAEAP